MVSHIKLKACIAAYIILTSFYYRRGVLRLTLYSVILPISFGAMYTMYKYLDTRPPVQQTIINSLMKMMVICFAILTLRGYVWSLLINILYPTLRQLVQNYPTLFCSLSNTRLTFIPFAMDFILLLIIKAFLVLFPHHFFNLNHEHGTAACIALITALVLELSFSLGLNGHYCHKAK